MTTKNSSSLRFYILVILLSLLPFISIFITEKLPHTHDGFVHLARIGAFFKALKDGQFPVRWAGDLNYGYGMPLFNFMYQVPYIVSSFFVLVGFGLVSSFKLTLLLSFLLSGIFMFLFAKEFFRDNKKAFFVTIFYQYYPFRLVELLIRGSFGEVYAYTFLPLVLFGLTRLFKQKTIKNFLITACATGLLILSHNAISLVFFAVLFGYAIFFSQKVKNFLIGVFSLGFGLCLSAFYWIPAIGEHKYTYGDLFMRNMYKSHFPPFVNFFIPNVTNNPRLQTGGIDVQFGIFHTIGLLLAVFLLLRHKTENKKIYLFGLLLIIVSLFFMQPISAIFWEKLSLLRQFQFPWRLLAVGSIATALLSVSYLSFSQLQKRNIYVLVLALVIFSTSIYWIPRLGFDYVKESDYWNFPLNTTYSGETDVIWSAGPAKQYPKQKVEIIDGKGLVSDFKKKSNIHTYTINAKTSIAIVDHTQYFPGWRAYVDSKSVPIQFQDPTWRGELTFRVPMGLHTIRVIFQESKLRLLADIISLVSIILVIFAVIFGSKIYKNNYETA